jgi:hypothetical protein
MRYSFSIAAFVLVLATIPACELQPRDRLRATASVRETQDGEHRLLGEAHARQQVRQIIQAPPTAPFVRSLLPTKAVAVAVVEPMLFAIYGKENIIRQRPYEGYLVDGVWYLSGTLPTGWIGGTFEILVDATTGRVLSLTHDK